MIWASMNILPTLIGVILLTGILAAGISSASTFLSLIGFSISNDVLKVHNDKKYLGYSRIAMLLASLAILVLAYFNPPQIFWIMYFGSTVLACSWGPVALASVWSKKITKAGAFWGMLLGFASCFIVKLYTQINSITLPIYLDPFFIGLFFCVAGMVIGSKLTKLTKDEKDELTKLHIMPVEEKKPAEIKKTKRIYKYCIAFGIVYSIFLIIFWAIPYLQGLSQ